MISAFSGDGKGAYLAFLPFDCFAAGFIGYIRSNQLDLMITNKSKNLAKKLMSHPTEWNQDLSFEKIKPIF
jgi:hypothetical protein